MSSAQEEEKRPFSGPSTSISPASISSERISDSEVLFEGSCEAMLSVVPFNERFQCSSCGKKLSSKHRVNNHIQAHTGIREYHTCHICGKAFAWKDSLNLHMKKCKHSKSKISA